MSQFHIHNSLYDVQLRFQCQLTCFECRIADVVHTIFLTDELIRWLHLLNCSSKPHLGDIGNHVVDTVSVLVIVFACSFPDAELRLSALPCILQELLIVICIVCDCQVSFLFIIFHWIEFKLPVIPVDFFSELLLAYIYFQIVFNIPRCHSLVFVLVNVPHSSPKLWDCILALLFARRILWFVRWRGWWLRIRLLVAFQKLIQCSLLLVHF